jgi:uncharacterized protein with NRDE domain
VDAPDVLGGRDLEAGGTWLAINRAGHFGVVTNRPDLPQPDQGPRSRGELVTGWVRDANTFTELPDDHVNYGGFSLLLADRQALRLMSGGCGAGNFLTRTLVSGVTGLSNTPPDQPWPKLVWLNQQLSDQLAGDPPDIESLMALLMRTDPVPDSASQGVESQPFVLGKEYGTRCSTVITISHEGACTFHERRFGPSGVPTGESAYRFSLEG